MVILCARSCILVSVALLMGCPGSITQGTIPIPGFGKASQEDLCGDSPHCDVQGKNVFPLLSAKSSRKTIPDPYAFVGSAFRPAEQNGLNGALQTCGKLDPGDVSMQTIHGTTKTNATDSKEFKTSLSANLTKVFKASASVNVERLVERTFDGSISFDRVIYTLKDEAAAKRNADCRMKICAQGRPCKPEQWATIYSASVITLSGNSAKTIKDKLVAKIGTEAEFKEAVDAQIGVGAGLDDAVTKALATSVEQYQFAAYVGYNDTLDSPTSIPGISQEEEPKVQPEATVVCMGSTQWRILKPGRYRFAITELISGAMSDVSLCTEGQKANPDCWRNFLGDSGKSWETTVPGSDTALTVWARQGSNAAGAVHTGCGSGSDSIARFSWDDGFRVAFSISRIQ